MLEFDDLAEANAERCSAFGHKVSEWSETDWMCAVAGEVGEAANLIKKRKRGEPVLAGEVADELADAVIYLDLLATRMGIDLGDAVRSKFNRVSERIKSEVRL